MGINYIYIEDIIMNELIVSSNEIPIYKIVFRQNFDDLPLYLQKLSIKNKKICIVTESNVSKYFLEEVVSILNPYCSICTSFIFPEGEEHKNLDTVKQLYEHLILSKFDRNDILIALGGGVVGDLTGYTAATFLRGIDFIQIPTSLLAQVDSSIGGKTGVDFASYKNMVGAFHQPKLVYINLSTLLTLNNRQFNSGLGEIIKHGLIKDSSYFNWIQEHYSEILNRDMNILYSLVHTSCNIKRQIVEKDPKEKGERALLNLGHTLGHAIEKTLNFNLYHGECVAIGCILSAVISKNKKLISYEDVNNIKQCFELFDFPKLSNSISIDEVIDATKNDKKMSSGVIKFILLKEIGDAYIDLSVSNQDMKDAIKELLSIDFAKKE